MSAEQEFGKFRDDIRKLVGELLSRIDQVEQADTPEYDFTPGDRLPENDGYDDPDLTDEDKQNEDQEEFAKYQRGRRSPGTDVDLASELLPLLDFRVLRQQLAISDLDPG